MHQLPLPELFADTPQNPGKVRIYKDFDCPEAIDWGIFKEKLQRAKEKAVQNGWSLHAFP